MDDLNEINRETAASTLVSQQYLWCHQAMNIHDASLLLGHFSTHVMYILLMDAVVMKAEVCTIRYSSMHHKVFFKRQKPSFFHKQAMYVYIITSKYCKVTANNAKLRKRIQLVRTGSQ